MPGKFPGSRPAQIGSVYTSHPCNCTEAWPDHAYATWAVLEKYLAALVQIMASDCAEKK